ncbi:MAG: SAF domain-containing protein, partial [Anaerolineae bacterium]|nr:SAF domain-containing protein [Anaerolineae bacterium]
MRLGRTLIIVAVVLLVLLVIVYMSTNGGDGSTQDQAAFEATQQAQMRPAVVMISPVAQGERITADKIQVVQVFQNEVNEFTFADITQVEGLYARINLSIGDYLELTLVTDNPISLLEDLGSTHAALIPEGMVAMPIPISRFSSVAYGINRGDHVNIIATMQFVDLDTEFQTILPNEGSSVWRAGERFVLTTTVSEQVGPGDPEGGSEAIGTLHYEDPLPQNVVAQAFRGGPIAPYGRAELDPLLNEPFYWVGSERQRPRIVSQSVIFNRIILHVGNFPLETDGGGTVPVETAAPEGEEPPPDVAGEEAAPAV